MDQIAIKTVSERVLEEKIDFAPEVRKWLLNHGYKLGTSSFKEYEYRKGALCLHPDFTIVNGGVRYVVIYSNYFFKDGKAATTKEDGVKSFHSNAIEYEQALLHLENELYQAQDDLKAFYTRWFKNIDLESDE